MNLNQNSLANYGLTILLPGLMRSKYSLIHLSPFLKRAGLESLGLSYPTTRYNLALNAEMLSRRIRSLTKNSPLKINFVGHSLGSQVARYIDQHQETLLAPGQSVGRIVMLAPPNQGSQAARQVAKIYPAARFLGPIIQDLAVSPLSEQTCTAEIGVIAGNIGSFSKLLPWNAGENSDGTVSIAETQLKGIKDWIEVRAMHSTIMYRPLVIKQIIQFIKQGHFARTSK